MDIKNEINKIIKKLGIYNKNIETKLKNIDKARYDLSIPCSTKRVSQNSRIYIPYELLKINNLTIEKLNTHKKGVCIGIPYQIYIEIKNNKNQDDLDNYLINNIGSDNNVSSILILFKDRNLKIKLEEEAIINNWKPIQRKNNIIKDINQGNDKWEGHYYYRICGGEQETIISWDLKEPQIFTSYKGFMTSNEVINDNKACLIYMLLHIKDLIKILDVNEINNYKNKFENYLKNKKYFNISCYDLILKLKCFNKDNYLISPILCIEINIDDFIDSYKINISHNISVSKNIIEYCENNKIMLSDYKCGNLFWDYKLGNMRQQEDTIEEYWKSIENTLILRQNLYF